MYILRSLLSHSLIELPRWKGSPQGYFFLKRPPVDKSIWQLWAAKPSSSDFSENCDKQSLSLVLVPAAADDQVHMCPWVWTKSRARKRPNMWAKAARITRRCKIWWLQPQMSYLRGYHFSGICLGLLDSKKKKKAQKVPMISSGLGLFVYRPWKHRSQHQQDWKMPLASSSLSSFAGSACSIHEGKVRGSQTLLPTARGKHTWLLDMGVF